MPCTELALLRSSMGEAVWASQYMQRPAPAGGGLVNTAWFRRYNDADRPAEFERIVQSWDTASSISQLSDFSVCTTWGIKDQRICLLNVYRKRLQMAELLRAIREQDALYAPNEIVIEDHGSGTSAFQLLQSQGFSKVQAHKPRGDKQMRMAGQAHLIEQGLVSIPHEAHWLPEFLHEFSVFPNGKYDDQVDSTSQAFEVIGNPQMKSAGFYALIQQENAARRLGTTAVLQSCAKYYAPGSMEWAAEQAALAAAAEMALGQN